MIARGAIKKSRYVRFIEGRRSEEMAQSNAFSPQSPRWVMAIEVSQNKKICGGEKNGRRKEIGSAILRRRTNRGSINIKK